MTTAQTQVFTFDQLSEQSRQVAIENHRKANVNFDSWSEPIIEGFREDLPTIGFDCTDFLFSGFWFQGDGAMFTYSLNDNILKRFIDQLDVDYKTKSLLRLSAEVSGQGNHRGDYCHSGCCDHFIYLESIAPYKDDTTKLVEQYQDQFEQYVIDLYQDQCSKIYSALEKYYYQLQEDEEIIEFIQANDLEFTEDGEDFE